MERRIHEMGYYDTDYLAHHQILGAKWGKKNGPPYPLGSGDHSAAEKKAASAAGVKVGKDSGKGSIENVKTKPKKKKAPLTEEEKRLKAEEARLKGDSKNINKYMDKLTTQELQDAQTRANIRKNLTEEKVSKAEKDKKEAMLSGDKEKVKEYATKMTYNELVEAMNKVDLMAKLNYEPPKPTTMDKIDAAMKKVDKARDWMQKGLGAYDALAAINNTFNKENKWPRAEFANNNNNNDKKKENKFENIAKKVVADAQNTKAENNRRQENKEWNDTQNRRIDLEEKELKFQQERYKDSKKAEAQAEKKAEEAKKAEEKETKKAAKEEKREAKKHEEEQKENNAERVKGKEYPPDRDVFNTSDFVDGNYRDLNMDSPSSTGERYLNQYLLEDRERNR